MLCYAQYFKTVSDRPTSCVPMFLSLMWRRRGTPDQPNEAERTMNARFRACSSRSAYIAASKEQSMKHLILAVLTIASVAVAPLDAKETSIAGTWTLSIEHIRVKLVLKQQKGAVTGTLDWPHGDPIKLTGAFTDERLTFFGESV